MWVPILAIAALAWYFQNQSKVCTKKLEYWLKSHSFLFHLDFSLYFWKIN